jgi:predicted nuclease of predicted toxin-antitoxin system
MKILVDMNLSPRWVLYLRDAGYSCLHWSDLGERDAPDTDIMRFAAQTGYVVLTHDLDFSAILAASNFEKPSVVQLRAENLDPGVIGEAVVNALSHNREDLDQGALISVEPTRMRLRLLPLKTTR